MKSKKALNSAWGTRFIPDEKKVLTGEYGKYGYRPRTVDLLVQTHVNFVWVSYSVGLSREGEPLQRALVHQITKVLHAHSINVTAYMDAHSMFCDVPQSVGCIKFNPTGDLTYRYSDGKKALPFAANLDKPGYVKYEQKRLSAITDDSMDATFFDNTENPQWNGNASEAAFSTKIRAFIHDQKHSMISIFSNLGFRHPAPRSTVTGISPLTSTGASQGYGPIIGK